MVAQGGVGGSMNTLLPDSDGSAIIDSAAVESDAVPVDCHEVRRDDGNGNEDDGSVVVQGRPVSVAV